MESVRLNANKKGGLGEALVFDGKRLPNPVSEELIGFVCQEYGLDLETEFWLEKRRSVYFNVTVDGEDLSWRSDGRVEVKWRSPGKMHGPADNTVRFAVEVKTGEYAELERDQKQVAEAIADAGDRVHPVVVKVGIDGLPKMYEISTKILG